MPNVKLHHPEDPKFVVSRDEDRDAPTYLESGWVEHAPSQGDDKK